MLMRQCGSRMGPLTAVKRRLRGVVSTRETGEEYTCQSCDARFDVQYHTCPDCGSYSVERLDW